LFLSTKFIIVDVVVAVFGIVLCVECVVILICLIKDHNKPRGAIGDGMILQPYPPYPSNFANYPSPSPPSTFSDTTFSKILNP
jgi:hypothetical protein